MPDTVDPFGSGVVWVAIPSGIDADGGLKVSVWPSPRFHADQQIPNAPTAAQLALKALFDAWPSTLANAGGAAFEVAFRDQAGAEVLNDDLGKPTRPTAAILLDSNIKDGWAGAAWIRLFTGVGPFGGVDKAIGGLGLRARVSPLAPELKPEDYVAKAPGWATKVAPRATLSFPASTLTAHRRRATQDAHASLFHKTTASQGTEPPTHLESVAAESAWGLPRRSAPKDKGLVALETPFSMLEKVGEPLAKLPVQGDSTGVDLQKRALSELTSNLAVALGRFQPTPPPLAAGGLKAAAKAFQPQADELLAAAAAQQSARLHRSLRRFGWDDLWDGQVSESLEALFAPGLHQRHFESEVGGADQSRALRVASVNPTAVCARQDYLAKVPQIARAQSQIFFARTGQHAKAPPTPDAKRADPADWSKYDFFQRLSLVQNYRGLLRPLGLVFDVVIRPPQGMSRDSFLQRVAGAASLELIPLATLAPDYALPTRTAYVLDLKAKRFRAAPRGSVALPNLAQAAYPGDGRLLDQGLVVLDGGEFVLETLDHDQVAHRTSLSADTQADLQLAEVLLPRDSQSAAQLTQGAAEKLGVPKQPMGSEVAEALGIDAGRLFDELDRLRTALTPSRETLYFPPGAPLFKTFGYLDAGRGMPRAPLAIYVRPHGTTSGAVLSLGDGGHKTAEQALTPQPRKGIGFSLLWNLRAAYLTYLKQREAAHEAHRAAEHYTTVDEEDLIAGFVPEARMCWPGADHRVTRSGWAELCVRDERYDLDRAGRPRTFPSVTAPIQLGAFSANDVVSGHTTPPAEDQVAPTLFSWSGGLLGVARNFPKLRSPKDPVAVTSNWVQVLGEDGAGKPLRYATPDGAGRLPYYEFRVRALDRANNFVDAGWSAGPSEADRFVVAAPLLREDPLPPPRILMPLDIARDVAKNLPPAASRPAAEDRDLQGNAVAPTSAWDRRSPNMMVVRADRGLDVRWIAPHSATLAVCDRYPVLDGYDDNLAGAGSFEAAQINPATGDFPTLADIDDGDAIGPRRLDVTGDGPPIMLEGPTGAPILTPYFPDPAARSLTVEVRDEDAVGATLTPTRVISIPLYGQGASWPRARMFRIELHARFPDDPADTPLNVSWDGDCRLLRINLPPGRTATLRLATSPAHDLDDLASTAQFGAHRDVLQGSIDQVAFERWTAAGCNPEISPVETITLVHAVATPLSAPEIRALHIQRDNGDLRTSAQVNFEILADRRATAQLELAAAWEDAVDDLSQVAPDRPARSLSADPILLDDPQLRASDTDTKVLKAVRSLTAGRARLTSSPRRAVILPFRDGRHYHVTCRAIAKSRYRDHFEPGSALPFAVASEPRKFHIPCTVPPTDPKPTYVLPTFGWDAPDTSVKGVLKRTRSGGGLRVYMERGMYSSGADEQVGILLLDKTSWTHPKRAMVEHLVSRWGADPLHSDPGYDFSPQYGDFLNGEMLNCFDIPLSVYPTMDPGHGNPRRDDFTTEWADVLPQGHDKPTIPVAPLNIHEQPDLLALGLKFRLIAYTPEFDPETGKWRFDVLLNTGSAKYFPFVRLAIVRFQRHSLTGVHLSHAVRLDFAQPSPDRTITVTRGDSKGGGRTMVVKVAGPRRDADGSPSAPPNQFSVLVQQREQDRDAWVFDSSVGMTIDHPGGREKDGAILAVATLTFPDHGVGRRRIVVLESEVHDGSDYKGGATQRIIYADVLELKPQFPWW